MDMKVFMKNQNDDHDKGCVVELKLDVPDSTLFSEARGENFHMAAKEAMAGMVSQLKKYSEKKADVSS
jgi:putative sigma-54 modulation protein